MPKGKGFNAREGGVFQGKRSILHVTKAILDVSAPLKGKGFNASKGKGFNAR